MCTVRLVILEIAVILIVLILCWIVGEGRGNTVFCGKVKNLDSGVVLLYHEDDITIDTLRLTKDGEFIYKPLSSDLPGIYVLYIPETSTFTYIYLRKGARLHYLFDVSHPEKVPVLVGDVVVESKIVRIMNEEFVCLDPEVIARQPFERYAKGINDTYNEVISLLRETHDQEFSQKVLTELNAKRDYNLYCFRAAYKLCISGETDVQDTAFWNFARKLDLNKIENAKSGLLRMVVAWDLQSGHDKNASDLEILQEVNKRVGNQQVLDYMAEECMLSALDNESSLEKLSVMYDLFVNTCKDCEILWRVWERYKKVRKTLCRLAPGKEMIDLEVVDRDGNHLKLSSIKNDIIYVDIWASWCGPCCYEMTFLEQLAQKYANNSRLMIISLSTDDDKEEWLAKAPADKSNWKQYWATQHAKEILENEYNISAIPHFMLWGGDGKIIDIHAPSPSDKNIDKLFHDLF